MRILTVVTFLLLVAPTLHAEEGADLFKELCSGCHTLSGPPISAPPMFAVKQHLLRHYPHRSDFSERIVQWVGSPSHNRALMPGAVRRFGLMPKLPYNSDQVRKIANFVYDAELSPRGRPGHRGMGMGRGCVNCGPRR